MEGQNLEGWTAAHLLGHHRPRTDLPWAIDQRIGDRWVETGRCVSKREADVRATRLISQGRSDPSSFRITERPIGAEPPRAVAWALALGLVAGAILLAVLIVTRS